MRRLVLALLTAAALPALPAAAAPSPQLVAMVEQRMRGYGITADLSGASTSTVSTLYAILLSRDDGYLRTRQSLLQVLRTAQ